MRVTFILNGFFVTSKLGEPITYLYNMTKEIPA